MVMHSLADDVLVLNSIVNSSAMKPRSWQRIRAFLEWYEKMNPQAHQNYQMVNEKAESETTIIPPPSDASNLPLEVRSITSADTLKDLAVLVVPKAPPLPSRISYGVPTVHNERSSKHDYETVHYERSDTDCSDMMKRIQSLEAVGIEIDRQPELKKAGRFKYCIADAEMSNFERLAVLGEEVGEVSHEVNETIGGHQPLDILRLKKELIQVAAVAVAWFERY